MRNSARCSFPSGSRSSTAGSLRTTTISSPSPSSPPPMLHTFPSPAVAEREGHPQIGQTRCYWALLNADLQYLYLDPTFNVHMGEQADHLVGASLLDFVHPDERASAQHDLHQVLENRALHGSVTRVRYLRLSRVRVNFGARGHTQPYMTFPHAEKIAYDENYLGCDIVINWVADNLVLCFIHAIVDISQDDNDETKKSTWSNWCGTHVMNHSHASILYQSLTSHPSLTSLCPPNSPPPTRIFQILLNQPARPILFSWPIDGYQPDDFGKLAKDVQIGASRGDAKTSCTRRYKAHQTLTGDGIVKEVESVFIPHGVIMFACHKVISTTPHTPTQQQHQAIYPYQQPSQPSHSYYEPPYSNSYARQPQTQPQPQGQYLSHPNSNGQPPYSPPLPTPSPSGTQFSAHPDHTRDEWSSPRSSTFQPASHSQHSSHSSHSQQLSGGQQQQQWPIPSPISPASPHRSSFAQQQAQSSPQTPSQVQLHSHWSPQSQPQSHSGSYSGSGPLSAPLSESQSHTPYGGTPSSAPGSGSMMRPSSSSFRAASPMPRLPPVTGSSSVSGLTNGHSHGHGSGHLVANGSYGSSVQHTLSHSHSHDYHTSSSDGHEVGGASSMMSSFHAPSSVRSGGNPPQGVVKCAHCDTTTSPEWRKGPSGKKDLCNACGLRYARSKQKKEGFVPTRRRKDKLDAYAPKGTKKSRTGSGSGLGLQTPYGDEGTTPSPSPAPTLPDLDSLALSPHGKELHIKSDPYSLSSSPPRHGSFQYTPHPSSHHGHYHHTGSSNINANNHHQHHPPHPLQPPHVPPPPMKLEIPRIETGSYHHHHHQPSNHSPLHSNHHPHHSPTSPHTPGMPGSQTFHGLQPAVPPISTVSADGRQHPGGRRY
ncbi:hypothetical protein BOTBODRAFT_174790 [Botryobasidium botryosum FD-172 SS1]|uniref:GATA-type domain-containing protein n=1 Tax=Botryobasidium botryosum (strain FD-172 SS1) TaxID=930990 RepID=A0A067MRS3_BOTB1|nr:hypothetical protein BOTBODRAFT_174790 [Botryobasidium botryosum FD-172 SS1]